MTGLMDTIGNEALVELGVALGLLTRDDAGQVSLDSSWFNNPYLAIQGLFTNSGAHGRRQALLRALADLFPAGSATLRGDEVLALALGGGTGLEVTIRAIPLNAVEFEVEIGLAGQWQLQLADTADSPRFSVKVELGLLGVNYAANGTQTLEVGTALDVVVGIENLPDAVGADAIDLDFHVPISPPDDTNVQAWADSQVVLVVRNAELAGSEPEDIRFVFNRQTTAAQLEDPIVQLLVYSLGLLGSLDAGAGASLDALVRLLGWTAASKAIGYPTLDASDFIGDPARALQGWFKAIWAQLDDVASPNNAVRLFLTELLKMVHGGTVFTIEVEHPYVIVRPTTPDNPRFELLLWQAADATGAARVHLGARMIARTPLGSGGPQLAIEGFSDILAITLEGTPRLSLIGQARFDVALEPAAGKTHAIDLATGSLGVPELAFLGHMKIRRVVAGLEIDASGRFWPLLELHDVKLDYPNGADQSWPCLDLTDRGAVVETAGVLAANTIAAGLVTALEQTPVGRELAILAGLARPLSPPAAASGYPLLDFVEFASKPLEAYELWFARLLGDRNPSPWFATWLNTLHGMLNQAGLSLAAITGQGTRGSPWRLVLHSSSTTDVGFEFAISPKGADRRLDIDLVGHPAQLALGSDARFTSKAAIGLLRFTSTNASSANPGFATKGLQGAALDAAIEPTSPGGRISTTVGPITLSVARVVGAVDWERGSDPEPSLDVVDPRIALAGAPNLDLAALKTCFAGWPSDGLPTLRLGSGSLGPISIGMWSPSGMNAPGLTLPDFDALDFSSPTLGLGSEGQWFVELFRFVLRLLTVDLPDWAFAGTGDRWRSTMMGVTQLFGGWSKFQLGNSPGIGAVDWPDFTLSVEELALLFRSPLDGLALRLAKLFSVPGGGPAGMAFLWRWIHGKMPELSGIAAAPALPAIVGEGTWANPWAIQLSTALRPVELLVWLDPKGTQAPAKHVGFGMRVDLSPADTAPFALDLRARADLFTLDLAALAGGTATTPAHPTPSLHLETALRKQNQSEFLLGNANTPLALKWFEFNLRWSPNALGDVLVPELILHDARFQPDTSISDLDGLQLLAGLSARALIGPLLGALAMPGMPLTQPKLFPLWEVFRALGLATRLVEGGVTSYRLLDQPIERMLGADGLAYLRERFWNEALGVPVLDPLQDVLTLLGASFPTAPGRPWCVLPIGSQGYELGLDRNGDLRVRLDPELDALDITVEAAFNPFTLASAASLSVAPGGLDLELALLWIDDGPGGNPPDLRVTLEPTMPSELGDLLGGTLPIHPVAAGLGERLLEIAWSLALELLAKLIGEAKLLPNLSPTAKTALTSAGVLVGAAGTVTLGALTGRFRDPVSGLFGTLGQLDGAIAIGPYVELFAADGSAGLRTKNGLPSNFGVANGPAIDLRLAIQTSDRTPDLAAGIDVPLGNGDRLPITSGLDAAGTRLSVAGVTVLPHFSGFDVVDKLLIPGLIEATALALESAGAASNPAKVATALRQLLAAPKNLSVSARLGKIRDFVAEVGALVEAPNVAWFDSHKTQLLDPLEAVLVLALGDPQVTRIDGQRIQARFSANSPLMVEVGLVNGTPKQLGIWLVSVDENLWPGPVKISTGSKAGAGIQGAAAFFGQVALGLTPQMPTNLAFLDPTLAFAAGSDGQLGLTVTLGSSTAADLSDDMTLTLLPSVGLGADDPTGLFRAFGLPLLLEVLRLAGIDGLLDKKFDLGFASFTLGDILSGAGLMKKNSPWSVNQAGIAEGTLLDKIVGAIAAAVKGFSQGWVYTEGNEWGIQIPPSADHEFAEIDLLRDPQVALVLAHGDDIQRIPLFVKNGPSFVFKPGLRVAGLGLALRGAGGGPLVASDVVTLGGVRLALDLTIPPGGVGNVGYGGWLWVEGLQLPLGMANAAGDPISGSLLAKEGNTNPGFDIGFGVQDGQFAFEFPFVGQNQTEWTLELDQQFGPLDLERLTLEYKPADKELDFTFDGSFGMGPLLISVDDFGLTIPLRKVADPSKWKLALSGLGVYFSEGGVEIAAALTRREIRHEVYEYRGTASVRAASFEMAAIGAYTEIAGEASLFVFALISVPLGGPPFFFIEGLAGGFGYNRAFQRPALGEIANHPLVTTVQGGGDPMAALDGIDAFFPPKRGAYWLVFGVKFNSFVFIKGTALLYVLYDRGFELGLLGRASLELPDASTKVLSVGLVLSVGFTTRGDQPMLWAEAQLTDDSWVLHSSCKLTGGFALRVWFNTGETVLTLGGYHPRFVLPTKYDYPQVPRIGLRWSLGPVTIKGECYFAITPREAMTGGSLEAVGKFGPVKAWFRCGVDVLIGWDPFYYDLEMRISVGFEVDLWLFTLRTSVGVELRIWGPELAGRAKIDLAVVTFTVRFGASTTPGKQAIGVGDFVRNHLKLAQASGGDNRADVAGANQHEGPFDITVQRGMIQLIEAPKNSTQKDKPIVRPECELVIRTRMPFNATQTDTNADPSLRIDLLPSGRLDVYSGLKVTFTGPQGVLDLTASLAPTIGTYRSPLPKAMFLGRAEPGTSGEERLMPDGDGDSNVELPDQLVVIAKVSEQIPSGNIPVDRIEYADKDHVLPFTEGTWTTLATIATVVQQAKTVSVANHQKSYGKARAKALQQTAGVPSLALGFAGVVSPKGIAGKPDAVAKPPAKSGKPLAGLPNPNAILSFVAVLEVVGVVFGGSIPRMRAASLTQTSTSRLKSAATASRVPAPGLAPRSIDLLPIQLENVGISQRSAVRSTGQRLIRGPALAQAETKALTLFARQLNGSDPRRQAGSPIAAGNAGVFEFPGNGVPRGASAAKLALRVEGDQAGRLVFLALGGRVIGDVEFGPGNQRIGVPAGTKQVVSLGLGKPMSQRMKVDAAGPDIRDESPSKEPMIDPKVLEPKEPMIDPRQPMIDPKQLEPKGPMIDPKQLEPKQPMIDPRQPQPKQPMIDPKQPQPKQPMIDPKQTQPIVTPERGTTIPKVPSASKLPGDTMTRNPMLRRPRVGPGAGMKLLGGEVIRRGPALQGISKVPSIANQSPLMPKQPIIDAMSKQPLIERPGLLIDRIDLGLPAQPTPAGISLRCARGPHATIGFDEGSQLLRVGPRVFVARGCTVELLDGSLRMGPLEVIAAGRAMSRCRTVRLQLPRASGTLIVAVQSSVAGERPIADAVELSIEGGVLPGKPELVAGVGRAALVQTLQAQASVTLNVTVDEGYTLVAVVVAAGSPSEWAGHLVELAEWDLVEDGPLSADGLSNVRLEVLA